eukprot:m.208684 g.208684  ORF g.208684 m.208684 type:complete len:2004 (-) comp16932_c1_seq2:1013-7024(-)
MSDPRVEVTVLKGTDLKNVDKKGKSDPYVILELDGQKHKTTVKKDELNPEWNETFTFKLSAPLSSNSPSLSITVKDKERTVDKLLGVCTVKLDVLMGDRTQTKFYSLNQGEGRIQLRLKYDGPVDSTAPSGPKTGDSLSEEELAAKKAQREANKGFKRSRNLYSTKKQDFQIRVRIIEARNLQSNKSLKPLCKLTLGERARRTRVHRNTNSPWFNELFYFNVNESPAILMDQALRIEIFNSRMLRGDALIGAFALDLALVYEQDNHHVSKKWVMLTNPKDRASGCMGFVKLSMTIVGEGDEAPEEDEPTQDVDEDIEENLLRPPGVSLEAIDLALKAFVGEDMPRMDTSLKTGIGFIDSLTGEAEKQHCDPYFKLDFAGRKARTSTKENTYFPVWMEELHVPATIPSLADRIRLQLLDDDPALLLNADDTIATTLISLSEISYTDPDEDLGFLPTFGPCFVNFYGATREYSLVSSDHTLELNLGKGEGCAYRGRVMIEIASQPGGDKLEKSMNKLDISDEKRILPFQSRKAYHLRIELIDLNMLSTKVRDGFIRVEASIGNIGNVLESPELTNSITSPARPTFDGSAYYYISWENRKPCLELVSDWEDIDYRYKTLNFLRKLAVSLDDICQQVAHFQSLSDLEEDVLLDLTDDAILALENFQKLCEIPLPSLPEGKFTRLDYNLLRLRTSNIKGFHAQAGSMLKRIQEKGAMQILEICGEDLADLKGQVEDMCYEPQLSIPDVILWILTDDQRRAYLRIPVQDIFFDQSPSHRGALFGQVQTQYMKLPSANKAKTNQTGDIPAQIQFRAWFGDAKEVDLWPKPPTSLAVLSEVYENQRYILTKWTDPKIGRYTDVTRKIKRPKDEVFLPPGWEWLGDWYISPEVVEFDPETAVDSVTEELWENQRLIPFKGWRKPVSHANFSSLDMKEELSKDGFELDEGWAWETDWQVDTARPCDHEGWEYGVAFSSKTFFPAKKRIHTVRRRRWTRTRRRIARIEKPQEDNVDEDDEDDPEGWLYAFSFGRNFHKKKRRRDFVRSRRWHRERQPLPDVDQSDIEPLTEEQQALTYSCGVFFRYPQLELYQVRAHIFQARNLLAEDSSGLSDPYLYMICGHHSIRSTTIKQNSCPVFDQVLIIDNLPIPGGLDINVDLLPPIVIEVFDYDNIGSDDFLGRTRGTPRVRSRVDNNIPKLQWYPVERAGEPAGEILAAFELVHMVDTDDFALPPPKTIKEATTKSLRKIIPVPNDIRPKLRLVRIDILVWGLRRLGKYKLLSVDQPNVMIECGGFVCATKKLKSYKANPNFKDTVMSLEVLLPIEDEYAPPLLIKVFDNRKFGRRPLVGVHEIKQIMNYAHFPKQVDPDLKMITRDTKITLSEGDRASVFKKKADDEKSIFEHAQKEDPDFQNDEIDWWTKFYASMQLSEAMRVYRGNIYTIYKTELERVFDMQDIVSSFPLVRGKTGQEIQSGVFKGKIDVITEIDEIPPGSTFCQDNQANITPVLVRVYIVRAEDLQPQDGNGGCDSYIQIHLGKKRVIKDASNYVPDSLSPVFGRVYEVEAKLPLQTDLTIAVWDHDTLDSDDLVGSTTIDLEDRWLSRCRATCGLPQTYTRDGFNAWRDVQTPRELLNQLCEEHNLPEPLYSDDERNVWVKTALPSKPIQTYTCQYFDPDCDIDVKLENAALAALRSMVWVPEHVETRRLYNEFQPGVEQGRLKMWIDMFPLEGPPIPPAIDISPRQPKEFELRVVVYNTYDVELDERSITGERMSDIYVSGFLKGLEKDKAKTDTHYRSLNGEGNFNWRLKYKFLYYPAEQKLVFHKKRSLLTTDKEEVKVPPVLSLQIWDNDLFSADDFLASIDLNLLAIPPPFKLPKKCKAYTSQYLEKHEPINLFKAKRVAGVFPCMKGGGESGGSLTGKLEVEIELLTAAEAQEKDNGFGRKAPNLFPKLEKPNRPPTSFFWLTSPWKTFRYIIWKNYKWYFIAALLISALITFLVLMFYNLPYYSVGSVFGSNK